MMGTHLTGHLDSLLLCCSNHYNLGRGGGGERERREEREGDHREGEGGEREG